MDTFRAVALLLGEKPHKAWIAYFKTGGLLAPPRGKFTERIYNFDHCPGAHGGRGVLFIAILVLVIHEFIFKQNQNDPVQDLQEERSNPDALVIVAAV